MARMTEEEAAAADKYYTEHTPRLTGDGKSGFIARHAAKGDTMIFVDDVAAAWLRVRAEVEHKTTTEIIGALVREKIAAASAWIICLHQNPPEIEPDTNGGFAARSFKMVALNHLSENYLLTRAMATHKTPTEIIGELVRKERAQAV